uniref:Uncharacterized protein n=1 Tax=Strongyloides stercoralis TaxID=6248 RepID=A0A0K0EA01_STRER
MNLTINRLQISSHLWSRLKIYLYFQLLYFLTYTMLKALYEGKKSLHYFQNIQWKYNLYKIYFMTHKIHE